MSYDESVGYAIDQLHMLMSDAPNHILKIKYDVMEHPAVMHMIKYTCFSISCISS